MFINSFDYAIAEKEQPHEDDEEDEPPVDELATLPAVSPPFPKGPIILEAIEPAVSPPFVVENKTEFEFEPVNKEI